MLAKQRVITAMAIGLLASCFISFLSASVNAATVNTTLRPTSVISNTDGTGFTGIWAGTGTPGGTCSGICDYIDEASSDGDTSYISGPNGAAPTGVFGIGGGSTSGQTATSIVVHVVARAAGNTGTGFPPIVVSLTINGSTTAAPNITFNGITYQDLTATFTGTWTKAAVDAATVTVRKNSNGLQPTINVSQVYVAVTYSRPLHTQTASRLYTNADSVTPGAPKAATNTAIETSKDVPFRLRMGITPTDTTWESGTWGPHNNLYKLQYAQLTAGSCSAQSTGWTDVASGSGAIRWYNNPSVADNASIGDLGSNDVTVSGTRVPQTYRESNGFTNTSSITTSQTGIWDFSLVSSGQAAGLSFCFRVINNDDTALNSYISASYPQILLTGDLGVTIVNVSDTEVPSPLVLFSSMTTKTNQCTSTAATLGTSGQRIRASNALVTNGWNVSLAAANPSDLWTSGSSFYDFNDASGCSDGIDGDAWGGRLSVNLTPATITPSSGCTNTGVSKGSNADFTEGTTNAITLFSATSGAARFCDWYLTAASLTQQVPAQTLPGTYSLTMVLTATAQ
ncbi:MAG TPA: hypothetical protein VGE13_02190 [Candidatus Saccharimonadales bacterium]